MVFPPPFKRRKIEELLNFVPECPSHEMVQSLNNVFGMLEEKASIIAEQFTSVSSKPHISDPASFAQRLTEDCELMRSLMEIQKRKLQILKKNDGNENKMSQCEVTQEFLILRKLFPGRKRFANTPSDDGTTTSDPYPEHMKAFLMHRSPIFCTSEFLSRTASTATCTFEQMKPVISTLKNFHLIQQIHVFPNGDSLILKDLRYDMIWRHLRTIGVDRKRYLDASVPSCLFSLTQMIERLDKKIIQRLEKDLWPMLAELLMATVVKDKRKVLRRTDFPSNCPNAVLRAIIGLTQAEFIQIEENESSLTFMKKSIGPETMEIENRLLGRHEQTDIRKK